MAKLESELEDTYYERSISLQEQALDKSKEDYEKNQNDKIDSLEESLKETDTLVKDSLETVKSNADQVLKEIDELGKQYGITISDSIVQPWNDGKNAISEYQKEFKNLTDSFIKQLKDIEEQEKEIQKLANSEAEQVVSNLVNNDVSKQVSDKASAIINANKKEENVSTSTNNTSVNKTETKAQPQKGDKVVIDSDAQYYGGSSSNIKIPNGIKGNQYTVQQVGYDGKQVLLKEIYSWVKISDLKGYAKGTTGVKNDQFAWIDEVGEELVLHAGSDGKLAYLTKGSSVIPSNLTKKLMDLAIDPTQTLEYSRPVINAPHITNNEINVNMEFGEVVHIDTVTNDTLPDLTKAVEKQMDKYLKNVNNQLRKYTR